MSEIQTPPRISTDENGDELVTFGPEHSWRDVIRWILSNPSDAEDFYREYREMYLGRLC